MTRIVTFPLRKVALASDRDDFDGARAMESVAGDPSPGDSPPPAPAPEPGDLGDPGDAGGDPDGPGGAGTIEDGDADPAVATGSVADGRDAHTEGIIAEGPEPAAEQLATQDPEPTAETGSAAPPGGVGTDPLADGPTTPVAGDGASETALTVPAPAETEPAVVGEAAATPTAAPEPAAAAESAVIPTPEPEPELVGEAAATPTAAPEPAAAVATETPTDGADAAEPGAEDAVVAPGSSEPGSDAGSADADSVGFDGRSPVPAAAGYAETGGDEGGTPAPEVGPKPSHRTAVVVLTVLTLVVVGGAVGALAWSRSAKNDTTPPASTQAQAPNPSPTLSDGAFVTYQDPETGFSIRYPRGWTRSEAPVREIRLVVSDGKQYSASVRVVHTEQATTPANLANIKAVTDGVVGPGVQILKQDPITVNGLIGYRYIYTFTDKDSGLTSAHLHYFLFQGRKMNSIVFEAVPTEGFDRIQGVFEQMLASFHSDPEPP